MQEVIRFIQLPTWHEITSYGSFSKWDHGFIIAFKALILSFLPGPLHLLYIRVAFPSLRQKKNSLKVSYKITKSKQSCQTPKHISSHPQPKQRTQTRSWRSPEAFAIITTPWSITRRPNQLTRFAFLFQIHLFYSCDIRSFQPCIFVHMNVYKLSV